MEQIEFPLTFEEQFDVGSEAVWPMNSMHLEVEAEVSRVITQCILEEASDHVNVEELDVGKLSFDFQMFLVQINLLLQILSNFLCNSCSIKYHFSNID